MTSLSKATATSAPAPFSYAVHAALRPELLAAEKAACRTLPKAFEITLYNAEVRAALKDNRDHPVFNERWAECQHIVVQADNEIALAAKLKQLYPAEGGFVIEDIRAL